MLDYHVILDLLPQIAMFFFTGRLRPAVNLSGVQQAILLAIGLQRKVLEDVEIELGIPTNQLLAMFVKVIRKMASHFRTMKEGAISETLPSQNVGIFTDGTDPVVGEGAQVARTNTKGQGVKVEPRSTGSQFKLLSKSLSDELAEGAVEADTEMKEKQRALIDALPLDR